MPNMARELDALFAEPDPPLMVAPESLELIDLFFDMLESTEVKISEEEDSDAASDFNKYDIFKAESAQGKIPASEEVIDPEALIDATFCGEDSNCWPIMTNENKQQSVNSAVTQPYSVLSYLLSKAINLKTLFQR